MINTIKNQKFNFLAKLNSRKFKFLKNYRNLYGKSSVKREYCDENVFLKVDRALSKLITLLISNKKFNKNVLSYFPIFAFWFQSLVKFLAEAHRGVHGFAIDEYGNPIERASVKIKGRDINFLTTKYGEFWRVLLPGIYKIEVGGVYTLIMYTYF